MSIKKFKDLIFEDTPWGTPDEIDNSYELILIKDVPYLFYSAPDTHKFICSITEEQKKALPTRIGKEGSFDIFYPNEQGELVSSDGWWIVIGNFKEGFDYVEHVYWKKSVSNKIVSKLLKGRIRSEIVEDYFDENNIGIHIDVKGLFNYLQDQYWAPSYIKYSNVPDFSDTISEFIKKHFKLEVKASANKFNLSIKK